MLDRVVERPGLAGLEDAGLRPDPEAASLGTISGQMDGGAHIVRSRVRRDARARLQDREHSGRPLAGQIQQGQRSSKAAVAGQRAQFSSFLAPSSQKNQALQRGLWLSSAHWLTGWVGSKAT